jgi:hypothetical protein
VIKREAERVLKYKDLIIEIQSMWDVEAEVIAVIIAGANKTISVTQTAPEHHLSHSDST